MTQLSSLTTSRFPFARFFRRHTLTLLVLLSPGLFFGCYGYFPLTRTVYEINGNSTDNGFFQSVVMWVFGFIWIYPGAMILDAAIYNLIEFWSGENPLRAGVYDAGDGTEVAVLPSEDGKQATLERSRDGNIIETRRVLETSEGRFVVTDDEGSVLGRVQRLDEGALEFSKPGSDRTRVLSKETLRTAFAQPTPAL